MEPARIDPFTDETKSLGKTRPTSERHFIPKSCVSVESRFVPSGRAQAGIDVFGPIDHNSSRCADQYGATVQPCRARRDSSAL